jgi:hypothetical protein
MKDSHLSQRQRVHGPWLDLFWEVQLDREEVCVNRLKFVCCCDGMRTMGPAELSQAAETELFINSNELEEDFNSCTSSGRSACCNSSL